MTPKSKAKEVAWKWWMSLGEKKRMELEQTNYGKTIVEIYNAEQYKKQ